LLLLGDSKPGKAIANCLAIESDPIAGNQQYMSLPKNYVMLRKLAAITFSIIKHKLT